VITAGYQGGGIGAINGNGIFQPLKNNRGGDINDLAGQQSISNNYSIIDQMARENDQPQKYHQVITTNSAAVGAALPPLNPQRSVFMNNSGKNFNASQNMMESNTEAV